MEATERAERADAPASVGRVITTQDDKNLKQYLEEIGAGQAMRISLRRIRPRTYRGIKTDGDLGNYDEPIDIDDIREEHGGGTYLLTIARANAKGEFTPVTTRKIDIPGNPSLSKIREANRDEDDDRTPTSESPGLVSAAMSMSERMAKDANARAEKAEARALAGGGFDFKAMEAMNAPLLKTLEGLQAEKRSLDDRITALMTQKPDTSHQDHQARMLEKMMDGESARIEGIRTQHASELRMKDEAHRIDLERVHAHYKEAAAATERAHERELKSIERSFDTTVITTKTSLEMQVQAANQTNTRLEREITKLDAELVRLRAEKVKTPLENMEAVVAMKNAMEDLGLGGKEEAPASTFEKVVSLAMEHPIGRAVAQRIVQGPPGAVDPAAAQQAQVNAEIAKLPVGQPMRLPNGAVIMKQADGSIVQVPQRPKRPKRKATPEQAEAATRAKAANVSPTEVATAVEFIETSIRNGTEPDAFVASARNYIPTSILQSLKLKGVDHFLTDVAKLKEDSPLLTQMGRNWVRKVGRLLIGDTE